MTSLQDMDALSLFDGMGCGWIALRELGITPRRCYASEIDKHAIAQVKLNFPEVEHLGDVAKWREWDIDWSRIGLLLAGSPCQGFSFAGKQLAFDDPRSALFYVFVDILNHIKAVNPNVKFLLENVIMNKESQRVINECLGLFPVAIDAALVSAQHRERLYWMNIRTKTVGLWGEVHTDIPQPKDRGIYLRDILQDDVPEKYYISEKATTGLINHLERQRKLGNGFGAKPRYDHEKMGALTVKGRDMYDLIYQTPRGYNNGGFADKKAPTLTSNGMERNNFVMRGVVQIGNLIENSKFDNPHRGRVYSDAGKSPCLSTCGGGNLEPKIELSRRIRKLTPTEFSRLQSVPEWYKWDCSDSAVYKMCGNGWNIEVIKHILKFLKLDKMRTIKFRGKRLDNGEWETGNLVKTYMDTSDECVFIADKMTAYHTPVDPATVGQFTGLTDKNGKEIFEGDVIEVVGVKGTIIPCGNYASDYHTVGARLLVKWFPAGFMLTDNKFNECSTVGNVKQYDFWNKTRSLIVIGNIHDIPRQS